MDSMRINSLKVFILSLFIIGCAGLKVNPLLNAHAHNDYEHQRPLFDALDNHFISIEVDVYLIDDELYVSHDLPKELDSSKTLEALYLKPLQALINKNKGRVYKGYDGFFYLMIDIKSEASSSYLKLKQILENYEPMISVVRNGKEETHKPVKIVVTGFHGRPFDQILKDEPILVSIDGRFNELNKGITADVMPYISENYKNHLSYLGIGEPSLKDKNTLLNMVSATHKEGKKLRFWASPDNEAVWAFLLNHKVDLINTDSLPKINNYLSRRIN